MTIDSYTTTLRGKRVVDFKMGDKAGDTDVVYRLCQEYDCEETQSELLDHFLSQIDPAKLEALVIGPWSEAYDEGPQGYLDSLVERQPQLTGLKALFVGDMTFEDCEISWINQCPYNDLLVAFPGLESLRIRGTIDLVLEPFEHSELRSLAVESGGMPLSILNAIGASRLPALTHLELWLGDDNYGYDATLQDIQRVIEATQPQRLRYLGLRNSQGTDQLASWLATQPWLAGLETLDLSLGTLGDIGAEALCASPHINGLSRLDLSHHYVSDQWQSKLRQLPLTVVLDEPMDEDDGERYVAVSE